jgi:antitoxin (DNA-binding transcriptional repressor) of toxin-antitoxin stability system
MKTATVRDLRYNFPRLEAWIRSGEEIEITKHGRAIACLVPAANVLPKNLVKPDIMRRLRETWGDRVFSAKEVTEMREAELEGEEG